VTTTLIDQVNEAIAGKKSWTGLASESPLRVAASMLSRAGEGEMSATRVVGTIGADDLDELRALVARISKEFGLEATVNVRGGGSFAVRFSRP
jgi:hypothetical protein